MDIEAYLSSFDRNDYQRDNFDAFLKDVKFSYHIPSIHIAGTNGKGSVANYLSYIYTQNNYRVGLFSTPDDFVETIKINNQPIDNTYVENLINSYDKKFKKFNLSSFEIQSFIVFSYFNDSNIDLAIIECGMGGELDATNIFIPILSIITTITIEHSMFLGGSLSEIAMHKSGIIKENVPVLTNNLQDDALEVVVTRCKQFHSKLYNIDQYHHYSDDGEYCRFDYRPYLGLEIKNKSSYSVIAACFAVEATNMLMERFPVSEQLLKEGLKQMHLRCRFEQFPKKHLVVIDGAHNPEAIHKLREECDAHFSGRSIKIVFSCFKDKNINNMLPEIGLLGPIYLTTFNHPRARNEDDYFLYLSEYPFEADYKKLINDLMEQDDTDIILVTGSLAFAYEVRKMF